MAPAKGTKRKALVTGGAGFLGRHLIQQLLDSGDYEVTCFDLRVAHLPGCASVAGDLSNAGDVAAAVTGMGVVFHAATAAPTAQNAARARDLMNQVNIVGTQNVIDACRKHGVPQLIYTSSASVVFSGRPLIDVDESHPYADPPMDFYTGTKAEVRPPGPVTRATRSLPGSQQAVQAAQCDPLPTPQSERHTSPMLHSQRFTRALRV